MFRNILLAGILAGASIAALAQVDTWATNSAWVDSAIVECQSTTDDLTVCQSFTPAALEKLFSIADFVMESRVMIAAEMATEIQRHPETWQSLGAASDQAVLDKAHELASAGNAVIAIQSVDGLGQAAIIMPGQPVPSGKWDMERVPLAAAARVDAPESSIYGKSISWVFSNPQLVTLFVKL